MEGFFKNCNLGEVTLPRHIQDACDALGITGDGDLEYVTKQGKRAASISFLFEAGFQKEVASSKLGHRDLRSGLSYLNTDDNVGKSMQNTVFGDMQNSRLEQTVSNDGFQATKKVSLASKKVMFYISHKNSTDH